MAKTEESPSTTLTSTGKQLSSQTIIDLHDRLNTLWIAYLEHLDAYVAAQKLMQQHMSAGFMQLARANFNAGRGVRRYGKDYYSQRAVASTRTEVLVDQQSGDLSTKLVRFEGEHVLEASNTQTHKVPDVDLGESSDPRREELQQPSPPPTPKHRDDADARDQGDPKHMPKDSVSVKPGDPVKDSAKGKASLDPLRWFGILVPPELRRAQASFTSALQEGTADCANSARRMREIEVEIRKLRKEIRRAEKAPIG